MIFFDKNIGGRKSSAYVAGSGGQITTGVTANALSTNVDGEPIGFVGSDDYAESPDFTGVYDYDGFSGLGKLSSKYESKDEPAAIGYDRTGGWSYGTYQIASATGAMGNFIKFCQAGSFSDLGKSLMTIGGENAARAGSDTFKQGWVAIMADSANAEAQHAFGVELYFQPSAKRIKRATGVDVVKRSKTLMDVVWSTAIQHGEGGCQRIFERAIRNTGAENPSDRGIIKAVYLERAAGNGMKYFGKSNSGVRKSVVNRFRNEMADAFKSLQDEVEAIGSPTLSPGDNLSTTPPIGPQ